MNADFESALTNSGHNFEEMPDMEGIIEKAYQDHFQKFSGKASVEGYVRVQFLETDDGRKKKYSAFEIFIEEGSRFYIGGRNSCDDYSRTCRHCVGERFLREP